MRAVVDHLNARHWTVQYMIAATLALIGLCFLYNSFRIADSLEAIRYKVEACR